MARLYCWVCNEVKAWTVACVVLPGLLNTRYNKEILRPIMKCNRKSNIFNLVENVSRRNTNSLRESSLETMDKQLTSRRSRLMKFIMTFQ
jgi:hypothetical protein